MERVQAYLNKLLQSQRFGGRTVVRDERTLIVFDTPTWGERESRAVQAKFPECEVSVQAFDGSISGFIVIVTRNAEPHAYVSEVSYLLALAALAWTAWWLLGYLQGGAAI